MSVEQELIEVTGFTTKKVYKKRQDYLAALARAVDGLEQDDFDVLSNEAATWFEEAVNAINDKVDLPDFESDNEEAEAAVEAPEVEAEDKFDPETGELEDEVAPVEKAPKAKKGGKKSGKDTVKAGKVKETAPEPEVDETDDAEEEVPAPKARTKGAPPRKMDHPPVKSMSIGGMTIDRFGSVVGTKNSAAIAMLTKGCRMADIKDNIGGTFYNLLKDLVKRGHHIEKAANGMMKLIHEDDVVKKAAKAKK